MRTIEQRLEASNDNVKQTIDIVWSAYRSVLSREGHFAYVSSAISSGKLLYELLSQEGLTYDELKAKNSKLLFEGIIKPNITKGVATAKTVAATSDEPVIAPTIFEAHGQRWSQDEYMGMWLKMISQNVGRMVMSDGWQYSNGGAEEFLFAIQMIYGLGSRTTISVETQDGELFGLSQGAELIGEALHEIHDMDQRAPTLASVLAYLFNVPRIWVCMSRDHSTSFNKTMREIGDEGALYSHRQRFLPLLKSDYGIKEDIPWQIRPGEGLVRDISSLPEGLLLIPEEIE